MLAKYEYYHDFVEGQAYMPPKPNVMTIDELDYCTVKVQCDDPTDYARFLAHVTYWINHLPRVVQVG